MSLENQPALRLELLPARMVTEGSSSCPVPFSVTLMLPPVRPPFVMVLPVDSHTLAAILSSPCVLPVMVGAPETRKLPLSLSTTPPP